MTVLDAFAVLALLKGEPAADEVADLLSRAPCALTSVGLAEVLDHLVRIVGVDDETAALDVAQLGLSDALAADASLGVQAGLLRAKHYHRVRCAVSSADCPGAETARRLGAVLATADPHLLAVCATKESTSSPFPTAAALFGTQPKNVNAGRDFVDIR